MNIVITSFFLLSAILSFLNCSAQENLPNDNITWSIEKCIEYAIENNIQVKQSELTARRSKLDLLQNKANLLPAINASASHSYNFGRSLDPTTNDYVSQQIQTNSFSLNSGVTIFNGLSNIHKIKQSQYDYLASLNQSEKVKDDIKLAVLNAYLQILYSQEQVEISKKQLEITYDDVERTKVLVEVGRLTKGTLLDLLAQLANEELNLVIAENQLELSLLDLIQLLELDPSKPFAIEKPIISLDNPKELDTINLSAINDFAMTNHPSIKSAEFSLKSSKMSLNAVKGLQSPTLSLFGTLGTNYSSISQDITNIQTSGNDTIGFVAATLDDVLTPSYTITYDNIPFFEQLDENYRYAFGINLSIPIFNGLQTRSSISKAKINYLNAQYSLDLAKNQLRKDIQQAYANAKTAQKKHSASTKSANAIETAFNYTNEKFKAGLVSSLDYNIAKNNKAKAASDLVQAKYDYIFKLKVLDYYQEKPIKF